MRILTVENSRGIVDKTVLGKVDTAGTDAPSGATALIATLRIIGCRSLHGEVYLYIHSTHTLYIQAIGACIPIAGITEHDRTPPNIADAK